VVLDENWYEKILEKERLALEAKMKEYREVVAPILRDAGVGTIIVPYDGYGDEGWVRELKLYSNHDAEPADAGEPDRTLPDAKIKLQDPITDWQGNVISEVPLATWIDDFAYQALSAKVGGWDQNEGSAGTITMRADGTVSIAHDWNVTKTEYEGHTL